MMKLHFLWVLFFIPSIICYNLVRNTVHGKVKGKIVTSRVSDRRFFIFTGVPYASPPTGKLRFQHPIPPTKWDDVKDALVDPGLCTQLDRSSVGTNVRGSEDCLYLKIAFPVNVTSKLPVMVWIHGGTYLFGSTLTTGADFLMEEDVVLVQVQYRLNVFGFLSTEDIHASGNSGLQDQVFALKWVKENIECFDGDPNKVTIFGSSAGGASVQLHMLSHRSRGLFHRAISQSGTPLNRWGFQKNPLLSVKKLAIGLQMNATNTNLLIKQLQDVPADVLIKAAFNKTIMNFFLPYTEQPFSPCIEKRSHSAFLTERALKLLEDGKFARVPYIMGYNTEEGSFPYSYIDSGDVDINIYNDDPELIVPLPMNIPQNSPCNSIALNKIKDFYFNNGSLVNKSNWINFMGHDLFIRGIFKSVDLICKKTNLYFYIFSSTGHKWPTYDGGAPHYSEVLYLMQPQNSSVWPSDETLEEQLARKRLVRLWTNFATFGNPTPLPEMLLENVQWPKFCNARSYLNIGTNLSVKNNPDEKDLEFWNCLFEECGFPPYYTY